MMGDDGTLRQRSRNVGDSRAHDLTAVQFPRIRQHLETVQRLARVGTWQWDLERDDVYWSGELYRILGLDPDEVVPSFESMLAQVHSEDRESVERDARRALERGGAYRSRYRTVRPDGEVRVHYTVGEVDTDPHGVRKAFRGIVQDVTEFTQMREQAQELEERYRTLFSLSPVAVAVTTTDGELVEVNRSWTEQLGYERQEILDRGVGELEFWVDARDQAEVLERLRAGKTVRRYPSAVRTASGEGREVELNADFVRFNGSKRVVWAVRDVTERNNRRRTLEKRALRDELTGLANRALLMERLSKALERARRSGGTIATMFVDLDDFKVINDRYGHRAGDRVLEEVARRMREVVRAADTVARLSGDEFVVVQEETNAEAEAREAAERLLSAVSVPIAIEDTQVSVRASVGISLCTPARDGGSTTARDLLETADTAMYDAKSAEASVRSLSSEGSRTGRVAAGPAELTA